MKNLKIHLILLVHSEKSFNKTGGYTMFEKVYWFCMDLLYLAGIMCVIYIPKNKMYTINTFENKQSSLHSTFIYIIGKAFIITSFSVILSFVVLLFIRS